MARLHSLRLPLLLLALGLGPLVTLLAWPTPPAARAPIEQVLDGREGVPLEIGFPSGGPETRTGGMPIRALNARWLRNIDVLELLVATYDTAPHLETARLGATDGTCEFRAETTGPVPNNGLLRFTRAHCNPADGPRDFMLWVRISGEGRVAVWTYRASVDQGDALTVANPAVAEVYALRGQARRSGPTGTVRRVDLLAHLWKRDAATIWAWIGGLGLCAALGLWFVRRPGAGSAAIGAGALAFALAGLWAVIMPPLQGADEPDHLLSFAEVTGAPQVEAELPWLARRTHFERLRFRGDERFRAADIDHPHDPAWTGDIHAERMNQRSAVAAYTWRVMGALGVRTLPLPDLLLAVRALNTLIFATVVGLAAGVLVWATGGPRGLWMLATLALLPTLPYFATMLSDWALLASWSVWLATALMLLQDDGPRREWAGLVLGVSLALLFGTSISAFTLVPLLLSVVVLRVLLGGGRTGVFWGGLAVGALLALVLTRDLFSLGFARYDASTGTGAGLLDRLNMVTGLVADAPWLLFIPIAALAFAEFLWTRIRARLTVPIVPQLLRHGLTAGALIVIGTWGLSLVVPLPMVHPLTDGHYTSASEYLLSVGLALVTGLRAAGFDHLTFTSLVSGFGWIDAILPGVVLAAVAGMCAAGFWAAPRHATDRQIGWLSGQLLGVLATLAAAALAAYLMRRNLHGRYVLAAGVSGLALLAPGLGRLLTQWTPDRRLVAAAGLTALHGISLAWVLARYM